MSATGRNLPAAAGASPEVRRGQRPSVMRKGLAPGRRAGGPNGPGEASGVEAEAARRERTQVFLARAAAGLGILVLWQVCAATLAPGYIARPLGVLGQVPAVFGDQSFWSAAGSTLLAVVEGLIIAVVIGTVIGLVMGRLRDVDRALRLYVDSFYAMPLVALVPLLTVWFGYTPLTRLVVVVIEAVLPIIFSVAEGARSLSRPVHRRGARLPCAVVAGLGGDRAAQPRCRTCSAASTWRSAAPLSAPWWPSSSPR